ncbi:MAG: hypothetical protein M3291_09240 [Actinomycetota bacterium]|nr:hypothetical protein [Actinomycetota bacterium]
MAATRPTLASFERLIRIADRLCELPAGTTAADAAIHRALGLPGEPGAYTTDEAALRTLLPEGFEMFISTGLASAVYGVVTRAGDRDYPHHGQWGATPVLAMCGALMRAHAAWTRAKS